MINIYGIDKAELLVELYNHSHQQGMGMLQPARSLTVEDARKLLEQTQRFDYINGKVMKVDLSGNNFDEFLYDRDNGEGAAKEVIDKIKREMDEKSAKFWLNYYVETYEKNDMEDFEDGNLYAQEIISTLRRCSRYNLNKEEKERVEKIVKYEIEYWKSEKDYVKELCFVINENEPPVSILLELKDMVINDIEIPNELEQYASSLIREYINLKMIGGYDLDDPSADFRGSYDTLLINELIAKSKNITITPAMKACKDYIKNNAKEEYKKIIVELEDKVNSSQASTTELIEILSEYSFSNGDSSHNTK